jgi:predicted outer membrane repeat protein
VTIRTHGARVGGEQATAPARLRTEELIYYADDGESDVPAGMVLIPGGEFQMGDHHDGMADSLPVHAVYVDSFYKEVYEVTNQQYCAYLNDAYPSQIKVDAGLVYDAGDSGNSYPYCETYTYDTDSRIHFSDGTFTITADKESHPMVLVSWYGAVAYANWRSAQDGRISSYDLSTWECNFDAGGYRLPTEAEWEYAARGGEHSPYYRNPWGDTFDGSMANYWDSGDPYETGDYPWTTPVGYYDGNQSPPGSDMANGYGLYDMAGNVWKWCNDWWDADYYDVSPYDNPQGPAPTGWRVARGGSWNNPGDHLRCAWRAWPIPSARNYHYGFRLVRALEAPVFVDAGATGASDGTSWADAYTSLQDALADPGVTGGTVAYIWVAAGTYMPDGGWTPVGGMHVPGSGSRVATFQLLNGVVIYGGFAGGETILEQRDIEANETMLSGDLSGDDTAVSCTQDSPDCDSYGQRCLDDGFCIAKQDTGENSYNVVTGSDTDPTAVLNGFTITAGNADGSYPQNEGAGMLNSHGSPTVVDCTFLNNRASFSGGAFEGDWCDSTLNGCVFRGNLSEKGGAIHFSWSDDPQLTECTFESNATTGPGNGGAVYFESTPAATLTGCVFSDNSAVGFGGAVYGTVGGGIVSCTFRENTAESGGALYFGYADSFDISTCSFVGNSVSVTGGAIHARHGVTITNSSFSGNSAELNGGAIYGFESDITVSGCTFSENYANHYGGGLETDTGNLTVANSVFWRNVDDADGSSGGPYVDESAQIDAFLGSGTISHCVIQGLSLYTGNNNLDGDPLFRRAPHDGDDGWGIGDNDDYGDLRLRPGSPAIDAGDNTAVPADTLDLDGDGNTSERTPLDLAGNPRFVDDPAVSDTGVQDLPDYPEIVDMGAYERLPEIYVAKGATGANDGTSWDNAYTYLQDALADAVSFPRDIWVAAGTYHPDEGMGIALGDRNVPFQLLDGVAIYGGFGGGETSLDQRNIEVYETILSGDLDGNDDPADLPGGASYTDNSRHIVTGSGTDASAVLDGFSVTGGRADGTFPYNAGAGLQNLSGSPTIANCSFTSNAAGAGAAIYSEGSAGLTLTGCAFVNNHAIMGTSDGGGGAILTNDGAVMITDCTFTDNHSEWYGGAINMRGETSTLSMMHSTLTDNTTAKFGGGMFAVDGRATLANVSFEGNVANDDGGGYAAFYGSDSTLVNCRFYDNSADGIGMAGVPFGGGALAIEFTSSATLVNCTLAGNQSTGTGPDDGGGGILAWSSTLNLTNCILWGNEAVNGGISVEEAQLYLVEGSSAAIDYSCVEGWTGGLGGIGNIGGDPLFVGPGDLRLSTDSPTIDAGDNDALPSDTYDLDGNSDTTEEIPIDLHGNARRLDDPATDPKPGNPGSVGPPVVDMGVYEYLPRIYVKDGNGPPSADDGTSWVDAYDDLQDALADPNITGGIVHEIWVTAGVYEPDRGAGQTPGERTATFQLLDGVAVYGGFYGDETALEQRDIDANQTLLSGDLLANDDPNPASDCCDANGGLGCDDGACQAAVCAELSSCCDSAWDERCGLLGSLLCCDVCGNRCDNSYHVASGSGTDATAVLDGLTITAGNADGTYPYERGGGMYNDAGSPELINCTFSDNSALYSGGGMSNDASSPTLINCMFTGNSGDYGGGMRNVNGSSPTLIECTFEGNASPRGAGMHNYGSSDPTVDGCTFSGNSAVGADGGGMQNWLNSSPTVTHCTFTDNVAGNGAAMFNWVNSNPTVTNCSFHGNSAVAGSGMLNADTSSPTVTNCAFASNIAYVAGAGMYNMDSSSPMTINCTFTGNEAGSVDGGGGMYNLNSSSPMVTNCILWGNSPNEIQNESPDANPTVGFSVVQGGLPALTIDGGGNIYVDPLLVGADNLKLSADSPAIDAGDTTALPPDTADLDGDGDTAPDTPDTGVPGSNVVDMGAYEFFLDCNGNGIHDECDLSCGAHGGACNVPGCGQSADCQLNGVPDECDIADCAGTLDCNDCNLNGIPDGCDDPADSIPDECVDYVYGGATDNWNDGSNWALGGSTYPDNVGQTTFSVTLQDAVDYVVLNVNVWIDTLRVLEGAILDVTLGDLHVIQAGGILIDGSSTSRANVTTTVTVGDNDTITDTNMEVVNGGELRVEGAANVAIAGKLTVGAAGLYQAAQGATNVTASLSADSVDIIGGSCSPQVPGGNVILTDKMSLVTTGDLTLLWTPDPSCSPPRGGCTPPPPRLTVGGGARTRAATVRERSSAPLVHVGSSLMMPATEVCIAVSGSRAADRVPAISAVTVEGDFINHSTAPQSFNWSTGGLGLVGPGPHTFEVTGDNRGASNDGFVDNFAMGSVDIDPQAVVTFVDELDNDQQGQDVQEALYVHNLVFGQNSVVTIKDCSVFYGTLTPSGADYTLEGTGELLQIVSFVAPGLPTNPNHQVLKNRYLSIDPSTNTGVDSVIKVEVAEMRRCENAPTRGCMTDADCDSVCDDVAGDPPYHTLKCPPTVCSTTAPPSTCIASGPCVDLAPTFDPLLAWVVQQPIQDPTGGCKKPGCPPYDPGETNCCEDDDWMAYLGPTVPALTGGYTSWSDVWADLPAGVLHITDCGIVPATTYAVYACDPLNLDACGEPLLMSTAEFPVNARPTAFPLYGDVCGGTVLPGPTVLPPDGYVSVKDLLVENLTIINYGGFTQPQMHMTWADLHGSGTGIPPAVYVFALVNSHPYVNTQGGLDPQDCP